MRKVGFKEQKFAVRLAAACVLFISLLFVASVGTMFSMMMVLFSGDAGSANALSENTWNRVIWLFGSSLAVSVIVPPVLVLLRFSFVLCLIPAGIGFIAAGSIACWLILELIGKA